MAVSDDEDDRPRRRGKRNRGTPTGLLLGAGVLLVLLVGGAVFGVYRLVNRDKGTTASSAPETVQAVQPAPTVQIQTPTTARPTPRATRKSTTRPEPIPPTPASGLPPLTLRATFPAPSGPITSFTATPDGALIVLGTYLPAVHLMDGTGKQKFTLPGEKPAVHLVAVSPDGKFLVAGGESVVRLWDVQAQSDVATIADAADRPSAIFTPDNKTLILGGAREKELKLWDIATKRVRGTIPQRRSSSLAITPDGKFLAAGGVDARVWDLAGGAEEPVVTVSGNMGVIYAVGLTPDGQTLVTGSADGSMRIWDVKTGAVRAVVNGHDGGSVTSLAISPDGKVVASGGSSGAAGVWDVATGRGVACAQTGSGAVYGVAIVDGGKTLLTASGAGGLVNASPQDRLGGVKAWNLVGVGRSEPAP